MAAGALTDADRDALAHRGWQSLQQAAAAQAKHVGAAEPAAHFLRMLTAAVASGRAHVAGPDGQTPAAPEAWGWRECAFRAQGGADTEPRWLAQGRRVGWVDGADLYLEPEASYAAAQELARDQGDGMPVSAQTLRKRLHERGLLASVDREREVLKVRRTLESRRREVLHLRAASLSAEKPDHPDHHGPNPEENGRVGGRVAGQVAPEATGDPTTEPDRNTAENGQVVGLVGSDTGVEAPAAEPNTPGPHGKRRRGAL